MVYERESQIAINYSRLEKKLKEVRTFDFTSNYWTRLQPVCVCVCVCVVGGGG